MRGLDGLIVLVEGWCPLARVAAEKTIEIFKA
jgi:hypothetical protein